MYISDVHCRSYVTKTVLIISPQRVLAIQMMMQIAMRSRALYVLMGQWHRANLARALHFCVACLTSLARLAFPLSAFRPFPPCFSLYFFSFFLPRSRVYQRLSFTLIKN